MTNTIPQIESKRRLRASAAILIGGKSSRYRSDKAFLQFEGRPLALDLCDRIAAVVPDVMLISNRPDKLAAVNARTVTDMVHEQGPLGGLLTALSCARHPWCFLTACDLPFLDANLIRLLWVHRKNHDIILPRYNSEVEPLAGLYHRRCLQAVCERLETSDRSLRSLWEISDTGFVELEMHYDRRTLERMFHNINTQQQYERALMMVNKS